MHLKPPPFFKRMQEINKQEMRYDIINTKNFFLLIMFKIIYKKYLYVRFWRELLTQFLSFYFLYFIKNPIKNSDNGIYYIAIYIRNY
jgi:hypothetical protein